MGKLCHKCGMCNGDLESAFRVFPCNRTKFCWVMVGAERKKKDKRAWYWLGKGCI